MLKKHFLNETMLVFLISFFWGSLKEQHLFEIEIFYDIINVFTVNIDASLL